MSSHVHDHPPIGPSPAARAPGGRRRATAVFAALLCVLGTTSVTQGLQTSARASEVTAMATAAVTSTSPTLGSTLGRTTVVIHGSGLDATTQVKFGAAIAEFRALSPGTLHAESPAGTGTVPVTLTIAGASVSAGTFAYTTKPVIHHLHPRQGPTAGGTEVYISGENLAKATGVRFGGTLGTKLDISLDGTALSVTTPARSAGPVDVVVASPTGNNVVSDQADDDFTYVDPAVAAPVVDFVSPDHGLPAGGQEVHVYGRGFTSVTSVTFGGTRATMVSVSPDGTQLVATNPAKAAGTYDVVVNTPRGPSTPSTEESDDDFTYSTQPIVSYVSPSSGPLAGGTTVSIYGANLAQATRVNFGTLSTTAIGYRDPGGQFLQVTSPKSTAARTVNVTVTTASGATSPVQDSTFDDFTYSSNPILYGMSTSAVPLGAGTELTLYGLNLSAVRTVTVGGTAATGLVKESASEITVKLPAKPAGTYDVKVSTLRPVPVQYVSANNLTYTDRPVITDVSPGEGRTTGRTTVTVHGFNLGTAPVVKFGATRAGSVVVAPDGRSLTAKNPAMPAGRWDVSVTNGTARSATKHLFENDFVYSDAPEVHSVHKSYSRTAGGGVVTVSGQNLTGATGVTFGGVAGTGVKVLSDRSVQVTVPKRTASLVDVVVTTPKGNSLGQGYFRNDDFLYTDRPVVEFLFPSSGPTAGGTQVTIMGGHFTGASKVKFGAKTVTPTAANISPDGTSLTIKSPAGVAGRVEVLVYTSKGWSITAEYPGANDFTYTSSATAAGTTGTSSTTSSATSSATSSVDREQEPMHPLHPDTRGTTTEPFVENRGSYVVVDGQRLE